MTNRPYIRSVELFRSGDFYGHHVLVLAILSWKVDGFIGVPPERIDIRVAVDGNIDDDLSFICSWEHLLPKHVRDKLLRESPASSSEETGTLQSNGELPLEP